MFQSIVQSFWLPVIAAGVLGLTMIAFYWHWTQHLRRHAARLDADLDHRVRERTADLVRTIDELRREIAGREEPDAALHREHDMMETFMRSVPDAVYFKDEQSRFIKCSSALARYFGVADPGEMIGKSDFDYFSEEHARPAFEDEQRIIQTGQPVVGLVEREVFPDGRVHWALTTKLPLRNADALWTRRLLLVVRRGFGDSGPGTHRA